MVALELTKLEVDTCLACGGIWLDSGELEMLLGRSIPIKVLADLLDVSTSKRRCPVCNKRMVGYCLNAPKATEIDVCTSEHGLWFDRGELAAIADVLEEPLKSTVLSQLRAIFTKEF